MSNPLRPPTNHPPALTSLEPVGRLLARVGGELAAAFVPGRSIRVSRAPGRLDVMGGIADYTGSNVAEATLSRAAAVALQEREDRDVQVFSFNLLDANLPFTLVMSLDAIAAATADSLRKSFAEPGRGWAGYLIGCLAVLYDEKLIDLHDPRLKGLNLALLSDVPLGAGVSSSAAIEVATMMNLVDHFGLQRTDDHEHGSRDNEIGRQRPVGHAITPMRLAALCQRVENEIVGAPCGIMDQAASCAGQEGSLMQMLCQPHQLLPPLVWPKGIRAVGINSNVKHSVGGGQYGRTRCAAFMAHKIILDKMRQMATAAGREMIGDPLNGYLANLSIDDYKRLFRPYLPELIKGGRFLLQYGTPADPATSVEPDHVYPVQQAADHHVLEANRVREFVRYLQEAAEPPLSEESSNLSASTSGTQRAGRKLLLDKAGHLMYASHLSYTNDAMLGADECDLLVKLVRQNESAGLYGAKITGGGSGGTVAVLCDKTRQAVDAIGQIMHDYQQQTGLEPDAFFGSSPGAWQTGTMLVDV